MEITEFMKKLVYLSMMIAVGIAAASCKKVEAVPSESTEGSTFALNASIQQTKTTINGLEVNWENNDVLYLVTTDGTWGKPYKEDKDCATIAEYTYSGGTFASEATIANGDYTFNALYDGSASQKSYHRGSSTTYNLQSIQDQDCLNPTGHLKNNDALVGTFSATVPMEKPASVSMSHIFAIMKVDVKNATGEDVELKSFEMSAAEATLAGVFTVNFANSPIDITEKSGQGSSIKVNLTNGTVASGESLPVYFVMAPLSNYSGDVTFTVTDVNDVKYTKTVTLTDEISFEAGSLNATPYKITTGVTPEKVIYSTGFESNEGFTAGTNYQSTVTVGAEGKQWKIFYGTPSTSSKITGSQSLAMRLYNSNNNYGYAEMQFDVPGATKVSFKAKAEASNGAAIKLTIKESTDGGTSWTTVNDWSARSLTSSAADYSFTVSGTPEKYRIRFEIDSSSTKPTKKNAQLTIDDVTIFS